MIGYTSTHPMVDLLNWVNDWDRWFGFRNGTRPTFGFHPAIDLYDTGDQVVVRALLPGVSADQLDISLEQNMLTISAHFGYQLGADEAKQVTWYRREIGSGQFSESIQLPTLVDGNQAQASFENGVLTLTLPKVEQARPKKITVQGTKQLTATTS